MTCVFLIEGRSFKELSLASLGDINILTASDLVRQIKELAETLCSSSHRSDLVPVGLGKGAEVRSTRSSCRELRSVPSTQTSLHN